MITGTTMIQLDMVATVALAGVLLLVGYWIRDRWQLLKKMAIPAPVVGGLLFALLVWGLRASDTFAIEMDTTLQLPFMLAFFTCVGFGGSFSVLKRGGRALLVVLLGCWGLAVVQGVVGVGLASLLHIEPVLGVMAGPVSLVGGHGNAAAFGEVAEHLGIQGASTVAIASATFGLVIGSLIGGPVGNYLIEHHHVSLTSDKDAETLDLNTRLAEADTPISDRSFITHLTLIFIFMCGGILLSKGVTHLGIQNFALPTYVGAMLLAIIFRNLNDRWHWIKLDQRIIDLISSIGLGIFLSMAIMTLQIWQLVDLALPLLVILVVQLIVSILFACFFLFPMLGRTYDSGVMTGGFTGWAMGIAATAVVCMSAITEKYHLHSPRAFVIVPLCGAVFVDLVAVPVILFLITTFS